MGLVKGGIWQVDKHGVSGGIEKWREAYVNEKGDRYRLSLA